MQPNPYSQLLKSLLPRGDCWSTDPGSTLSRTIVGLSQEFVRTEGTLSKIIERFFPQTDGSFWPKSLLIETQEILNLSLSSVLTQFVFYGIKNVEFVTPEGEPFKLYINIAPMNERFFEVGDPVGNELYQWRDERLETAIGDIIPAFCEANFVYRSKHA